jgi:hypothetical protein
MEGSALPLLLPLRETKRLDPGISEKEDFFLVAFISPLIPEELDKLALVPVDKSSAIGMDPPPLLHWEDDNVGEWSGFFPRRNILNAPSHLLRGGVPHGDGAIITESELVTLWWRDKQEVDPSMNWASCGGEADIGIVRLAVDTEDSLWCRLIVCLAAAKCQKSYLKLRFRLFLSKQDFNITLVYSLHLTCYTAAPWSFDERTGKT